jgi:protein-disulfide isomerase
MRRPHRTLFIIAMLAVSLAACNRFAPKSAATPDDMSLGNPAAKVTVVEYASVACPVCGRWYREVYPAFKAKYIDTGKIHYVFREMLVGGDQEVSAAAAGFLLARCAGKDKYFAVTDAIFQGQQALFDNAHDALQHIAQSVGMNPDQFNACITNDAALQALDKRTNANAMDNHVTGTPTFVINGKPMETGYHPLSEIDAAIAAAQAGH